MEIIIDSIKWSVDHQLKDELIKVLFRKKGETIKLRQAIFWIRDNLENNKKVEISEILIDWSASLIANLKVKNKGYDFITLLNTYKKNYKLNTSEENLKAIFGNKIEEIFNNEIKNIEDLTVREVLAILNIIGLDKLNLNPYLGE